MSVNPFRTATGLFRIADYRRLWVAGALTGITRWLEFIALGIYAYELTHSPPLVALLAVIRMAPYALLGFFIGALADRFDRRLLLIAASAFLTVTMATMAALTTAGIATYPMVAVATFISGLFWTIDMPVRRRLVADRAGEGNIAAALGLDNATTYATRALGPLIGGATYQFLGMEGIYALIALAYATCFKMAIGLTRDLPDETDAASAGKGLLAALAIPHELIFNRRFAIIMGITLVHNVCSFPFLTMVPVISQKDFQLAPVLVGFMSSLEGFGGTIGAILVGIIGSERTLFRFYYWGPAAMMILILLLSFHLELATAVPALLAMGCAVAAFTATQYALVHVSAPPHVRGRATGVLSIFIGSSMFGHYLAGQLFGAYPSPVAMRILACGGLVAMAVLGLLWLTSTRPATRPHPETH
ncbi:MAG: MFS transporter [Hyphomicrobiaceae bacterium]